MGRLEPLRLLMAVATGSLVKGGVPCFFVEPPHSWKMNEWDKDVNLITESMHDNFPLGTARDETMILKCPLNDACFLFRGLMK